MKFNENLKNLRKQKGLTQEELASALFVSRTAVSKWESGRGLPSIDSLKQIADFFSVSLDALLSGEEICRLADKKVEKTREVVFGLLDIAVLLLFFLPIFAFSSGDTLKSVSLLTLATENPALKIIYIVLTALIVTVGLLSLAFQEKCPRFVGKLSVVLNALGVALFIVGRQSYAAALLFTFLMIKGILLLTRRVS